MVNNKAWTMRNQQPTNSNMYSGMFNKVEKEKQRIDDNAQKVNQSFVSF